MQTRWSAIRPSASFSFTGWRWRRDQGAEVDAGALPHFATARAVWWLEACGGAQHWARRLQALGHEVRLLPAQMVRPFVGGNKSDARDARAIWTAAGQPGIKTVAVKSEEQQAILALHRGQQLVKFRTAQSKLLGEYGEVMARGRAPAPALERLSERLPAMVLDRCASGRGWIGWMRRSMRSNVALRSGTGTTRPAGGSPRSPVSG